MNDNFCFSSGFMLWKTPRTVPALSPEKQNCPEDTWTSLWMQQEPSLHYFSAPFTDLWALKTLYEVFCLSLQILICLCAKTIWWLNGKIPHFNRLLSRGWVASGVAWGTEMSLFLFHFELRPEGLLVQPQFLCSNFCQLFKVEQV